MTPKERVMTALRRGRPDRVPWLEGSFDERLQTRIMGGRSDFTPAELCRTLGMDGFGYRFPTTGVGLPEAARAASQSAKEAFYFPKRISFDFSPPWIAEMSTEGGRSFVKKGLLVDRDSLKLFDDFLPDPDHPARYEQIAKWIDAYREDYAVFARVRLGTANTIESMGLDVFSLALYDDPDLVKAIHERFSEWSVRVVANLNKLDFDFYWAFDDHADTKMPWVDRAMYAEFFYPYQKRVADAMNGKPWAFHSDGNLFPILDGLLPLGMSAIHPIQPSAMDIGRMKTQYGSRVCLIGNIDLDYTLTRGTPDEVETEVRERIALAGKGGGYILSSANSLTDYCKTENVRAMAHALQTYGKY
jgi:uroporphyrinogen decarboxylase-like protein